MKVDGARSKLDRDRRHFAQFRPAFGPKWPGFDKLGALSTDAGRCWQDIGQIVPIWERAPPNQPRCNIFVFVYNLAALPRCRAEASGRIDSPSRRKADTPRLLRSPAESVQSWSGSIPSWSNLVQIWSNTVHV